MNMFLDRFKQVPHNGTTDVSGIDAERENRRIRRPGESGAATTEH